MYLTMMMSVPMLATSRNIYKKMIKFIYSDKATKFCEIFTLLLTVCTVIKSKVKILQHFVAFLEYIKYKMKFSTVFFLGIDEYSIFLGKKQTVKTL